MMPPNFSDLIEIQRAALFISDSNKKLLYIREPGYDEPDLPPAPRFFMSRSPSRNIWSFRDDVPHDITHSLHQLCLQEPSVADFAVPFLHMDAIREILNTHRPLTDEWRGPAYWLPKQSDLSEQTTLITEANSAILEPHFSWQITARTNFKTSPVVATVVNGVAVSICHCARLTEVAAEAGVETAEGFRGQGHAGKAVARWAETLRQQGIIPLYSTSWENVASQRVANKLRAVNYGENWHLA